MLEYQAGLQLQVQACCDLDSSPKFQAITYINHGIH